MIVLLMLSGFETLQTIWLVTGHITGATIRSFLLLPKGYNETNRYYPTILYLHGRGGKENHTFDEKSFFNTYGTINTVVSNIEN